MALVIKDRVRQTSTTAGTGTITLSGSVTGFQDFSVIGTGNTTYYTIADQSGFNWEVGLGTYTSPDQLSRDTVYESSNGNALVNFGSNTKDVFVTLPAEGFASPPAIGGTTPNNIKGTEITAYDDGVNYFGAFVLDSLNNTGYSTIIDGNGIYRWDGIYNSSVQFPYGINSGDITVSGSNTISSPTFVVSSGGAVVFLGGSSSGAIYLKIPTTGVTTPSYTFTLPPTSGSNGYILKTDGTGVTSWLAPSALDLSVAPAIGATTPSTGKFTTVQSTVATGTAPFTVASTTNVANLNASLLNGATFAAPGAIGSTTASTGKFTTVESTVTTGTAPFTVASTTNVANLNASSLNGATFAAPGSIGSTTAGSGAFTTLSASSNATLTAISDPSAPSNGNVAFYAKTFGGYPTLAARNALNTSFGLQSALWSKSIQMWTNTAASGGQYLNSVGGGNGTFSALQPTVGATLYQTIRRSSYANVITTTNQLLGVNNNYFSYFRGSTTGQGGFFYHARLGFEVWTNGGRFFAGMCTGTSIVTADPSTRNDCCGFAVDVADNGAISFLTRNTTTATKASTGYTIVSNKGYDLYIYCPPNGTTISWMITDINAGTSASGSATATLPTATTLLGPHAMASNAALTPATSISIGVVKVYTECDY